MMELICDVCGGKGVAVACSALGAISFAYCQECANVYAEPYDALVYTLAMYDGIDGFRYPEIIKGTLARTGKTTEQLKQDVERETKEMMEQFETEYEERKGWLII